MRSVSLSKLVRDIVLSSDPLRLDVPRDGRHGRAAPLVYTELDMTEAVRLAAERGREIAHQEAEAHARELQRSVDETLGALTHCLEGFEAARRAHLEVSAREVVELALLVARAVVGSELVLRPESVATVVATLLEELRDAERVSVRLAPLTLELLRASGGAVSDDRVRWVADSGLGPSDARVDSDRGGWDAAVETRWRRISETVRSAGIDEVRRAQRAADEPEEEDGTISAREEAA